MERWYRRTFLASTLCSAWCVALAVGADIPTVPALAPSRGVPQAVSQTREQIQPVSGSEAEAEWSQPARPISIAPAPGFERSFREALPREGICEDGSPRSLAIFVGYDSWKGIADDGWQNNGISVGGNLGARLGNFSDWTGIGLQVGGSVITADWSGTDYRLAHNQEAETQGFLTYGLFRRSNERSGWSAGIVQDWMFNNNFGVFAESPTLSQWRGQLGYALNSTDEVGVWGTYRWREDSKLVESFGRTTWRPVSQIAAFWHHRYPASAVDTWIWFGVPERDRLTDNGSLGDYLATALAIAPLSDYLSLYAMVSYMHPSASAGLTGSTEEAWNFTIGISLYPGRDARSETVAGRHWTPLMPVANNGFFLVDVDHGY